MTPLVTINEHTTSSTPRPHILYTIQLTLHGKTVTINKRYSEVMWSYVLSPQFKFKSLGDEFVLPPKRITKTFMPSAWVDDSLINERKSLLTKYLSDLLKSDAYKDASPLLDFLADEHGRNSSGFDIEDVIPSTLSKETSTMKAESTNSTREINADGALIAAAYYVSWTAAANPPEGLDFSKFDILFFVSLDSGSTAILKRLATAAHNSGKGTRVVLSIGGWGGCQYWSSSVSSSANRTKLVNSIKSVITTNNLDGVDIDWEFPNSPGAGQPYSPSDSANLLSFFKALRTALGASKIISAAVSHLPWLGANGKPLTDVSAYAAQMNYINIMYEDDLQLPSHAHISTFRNYDVWGASATPGPNAPLGDLCGTSKQPQANAHAALAQWKAAGFPASQQLLGLPLYGYVSKSSKTVLTGSSLPSSSMLLLDDSEVGPKDSAIDTDEPSNGDHEVASSERRFVNGSHARDENNESKVAPASTSLSSWWGQQIPFNSIVKSGALVKKSDGTYGQGGGFTMGWDNCSDTPYLYNTAQTTVVTYDDTYSFGSKAAFAKKSGMAGCFTWSLDQDRPASKVTSLHEYLAGTHQNRHAPAAMIPPCHQQTFPAQLQNPFPTDFDFY
ncbi:hypothetical protein H0H93_014811 [Arthromyces matolae]|nr:hypothetical protein H0H93_014811 [Arthromyces matolae]